MTHPPTLCITHLTLSFTPTRPPRRSYFNTANVSDGSVVQMSTRERPKLLFGADGEPTHLYNGVCPTPNCFPQAAIQCKVQGLGPQQGYWDHTLVVPLDYS
jgi:hypothetical protein